MLILMFICCLGLDNDIDKLVIISSQNISYDTQIEYFIT
jgi:hypothetical protein